MSPLATRPSLSERVSENDAKEAGDAAPERREDIDALISMLPVAVVVGAGRLIAEWVLGQRLLVAAPASILMNVGFYWAVGAIFLTILRITAGTNDRANGRLVRLGLLLGVLPPFVDVLRSGLDGFRYEYLRDVSRDFRWFFYNPGAHVPFGEALSLWLSILGTTTWVALRTRSTLRTIAALALAYGGVVFVCVFFHLLLMLGVSRWELSLGTSALMRGVAHLALVAVLAMTWRRQLFVGLLKRTLHVLPGVATVFVGSALQGSIGLRTWAAAGFTFLAGWIAIVHNDWFDRRDDAPQQRFRYVIQSDLTWLNLVVGTMLATWALEGSPLPWILAALPFASILYSYEPFRWKKRFPNNLLVEGVWGATAALAGVVAAVEDHWGVAPLGPPSASRAVVESLVGADRAFNPVALCGVAFAFAGWCAVAAIKDRKDVDADAAAGTQTVYTLALRAGWSSERVDRWVVGLTATCLALPGPLVWWFAEASSAAIWLAVAVDITFLVTNHALSAKTSFQVLLALIGVELAGIAALVAHR